MLCYYSELGNAYFSSLLTIKNTETNVIIYLNKNV